MSRLTRDGTAEPVLRGRILRRVRGQGDIHFPCSAEHEQDGQLHPVDPYSAIICDDHTYQSNVATVAISPTWFHVAGKAALLQCIRLQPTVRGSR